MVKSLINIIMDIEDIAPVNKYLYNDLTVDKGFIKITCPNHGDYIQYLYFHEYLKSLL